MINDPAIYDLAADYSENPSEGVISETPYWVLAVVRLDIPLSFDRDANKSVDKTVADVVAPRKGEPTLIIISDCVQCMIHLEKGSPFKNLKAQLLPGKNYMREILPGDWLMAWMFYGQEKLESLVKRIKAGYPCNRFDDGLKFVGRVHSIRKSMMVERNSGIRSESYDLQGMGFAEFGYQSFYDPLLAQKQGGLTEAYKRIGVSIQDMMGVGGIETVKAIPQMFDLMLGRGLAKILTNPADMEQLRIGTGLDSPVPAAVPTAVGNLLNKSSGKDVLPYSEICELHYGLQRYSGRSGVDTTPANPQRYKIFLPDGITKPGVQYQYTYKPVAGTFIPQPPDFSNKSVWAVLSQWVNPLVNEMYTALKVNPQGSVVPTLVLRQRPFTTPYFYQRMLSGGTIANFIKDVTPYHELPRWKISPSIIYNYNVGRSDAMRCNFLRVIGAAAFQQEAVGPSKNLVRSALPRDDLDTSRNGIRMQSLTINCGGQELPDGPHEWTEFASDFMIGQHLSMTGTISLAGVQAPIAEGDNCEVDETLFHIEAVTHSCQISRSGEKSFTTALSLSHGLNATPAKSDYKVPSDYMDDPDSNSGGFTPDRKLANDDPAFVDSAFVGPPEPSTSPNAPSPGLMEIRFGPTEKQAAQLYPGMGEPNEVRHFEGEPSLYEDQLAEISGEPDGEPAGNVYNPLQPSNPVAEDFNPNLA